MEFPSKTMQCRQNNDLSLSSLLPSRLPKSPFFPSTNRRTVSFPTAKPTSSRTNLIVRAAAAAAADLDVREEKAAKTMYDVLLVPESADQVEIKAAFRRQARRWHPDTCQSPAKKVYYSQRFMKAKEAYTVLSDPELREEYDFMLRTGLVYHGLFGGESGAGLGGVAFRKGKNRGGGECWGFGDWESQLDGLRKRRDAMFSSSSSSSSSSWGSRMRAGQHL